MKYSFLNTQQGGIQNSHRSSRLIRPRLSLVGKMDVKSFLIFIVAEKHWKCKYLLISIIKLAILLVRKIIKAAESVSVRNCFMLTR